MREIGEVRKRFYGDTVAAMQYMGLARHLLGELKARMRRGGLQQLTQTVDLPGGVRIAVASIFGADEVRVFAPIVVAAEQAAPRRKRDVTTPYVYAIGSQGVYKIQANMIGAVPEMFIRRTFPTVLSPAAGSYVEAAMYLDAGRDEVVVAAIAAAGDTQLSVERYKADTGALIRSASPTPSAAALFGMVAAEGRTWVFYDLAYISVIDADNNAALASVQEQIDAAVDTAPAWFYKSSPYGAYDANSAIAYRMADDSLFLFRVQDDGYNRYIFKLDADTLAVKARYKIGWNAYTTFIFQGYHAAEDALTVVYSDFLNSYLWHFISLDPETLEEKARATVNTVGEVAPLYPGSATALNGKLVWYRPTADLVGRIEAYSLDDFSVATSFTAPSPAVWSNLRGIYGCATDHGTAFLHLRGNPLATGMTICATLSGKVARVPDSPEGDTLFIAPIYVGERNPTEIDD